MITATLARVAPFYRRASRPCGGRGIAVASVTLGHAIARNGDFLQHESMRGAGGAVRMCEACIGQAERYVRIYGRPVKVAYFTGETVILGGSLNGTGGA